MDNSDNFKNVQFAILQGNVILTNNPFPLFLPLLTHFPFRYNKKKFYSNYTPTKYLILGNFKWNLLSE